MAENQHADTANYDNQIPVDEQLSDILLVFDKEEKQLKAVKGIDEKGELKTAPADSKSLDDFMKVDKQGNMLSNFFSNFMRQAQNPSRFSFFKIPIEKSVNTIEKLQNHLAKLTEKGKEYLKKYEVSPEQYIKQEQKAATLKQEGETAVAQTPPEAPAQAQVQEAPAQAQVQEAPAQAQAQEAPAQAQAQEAPAQAQSQSAPIQEELKYNPDAIDWETLQNLGVSRESLEKRNLLEPLLKGYKTNELVPISFNLGSTVTRFDARLSLREVDGKVAVAIHGMRKEPQLDYPFFGHEFSEEDKKNLLTTGNMGRTVELTNSKTQEKIPSIISIDRLTNEIIALRSEHIKVPDEIKGVKLSEEQKQTLKEGKPLFVEGMTSKKGEPFNATVQFNADKRYVEFLFEDKAPKLANQEKLTEAPTVIRGVTLTEEQHKELSKGNPIYLEGLQSKAGKTYSGYFTFDKDKGKVEMSFNNPQKDITDKVSSTKQKAETSKAKEEKRPQKQSEKTAQKETAKKSKGRKV